MISDTDKTSRLTPEAFPGSKPPPTAPQSPRGGERSDSCGSEEASGLEGAHSVSHLAANTLAEETFESVSCLLVLVDVKGMS